MTGFGEGDDFFDELFGADEGGEEEDEDEEGKGKRRYSSKQGLIFVVDCDERMFEKGSDGRMPFQTAMDIAFLTLKRRVVTDSGSGSSVGLVFYNTKDKKNENGFENVFEFHNLGGISVERIRDVRNLEQESNVRKFQKTHGGFTPGPDDCPLERALWLCNFAFSGMKFQPHDEAKVWIFTCNDQPHNGSSQAKVKLSKRMEDLFQTNQRVNLWPLVPKEKFDEKKFFKESLAKQNLNNQSELEIELESEAIIYMAPSDLEDMNSFVKKKDFPKRRLAPMMLNIGENIHVGLDLYPFYMKASVPSKEKVDAKSNQILRRAMKNVCIDTLNDLTPDQILPFFQFGIDARVFFTKEEVALIKNFGEAHTFTLLGFKHVDCIKPWHSFRTSYFVVPSERSVAGSTKLFLALLDVLKRKNYVIIASGVLRSSETVKLFAMLPREERVNEQNEIIEPCGFDVILLPWANDIRHPKFGAEIEKEKKLREGEPVQPVKAPNSLIEKGMNLMKAMNLATDEAGRFLPYSNPAIDKHFAILEYAALDQEEDFSWDETRDDETRITEEHLTPEIKRAIKDFANEYGGPENAEAVKENEKKRKPMKEGKAAPKKRLKTETAAPSSDWEERLENGTLNKFTLVQLKAICSHLQLRVSGKKQDLIDRITEKCESKSLLQDT